MKSIYLLAAALAAGVSADATGQAASAKLGDPAPALEIAEWVKGGPVDLAAGKGKKVFVVEFWATWCPPCRTSIPHLTELQKKYKADGVVFIGISDEKPGVVKPFVEKQGNKMEYVVAIDKERKTSAGYMKAFGINGIPHAFVVDKEGRIVWQGHPMAELDETIRQILDGKYDMNKAKKRAEAQALLEEYYEVAADDSQKDRADELEKKLVAIDTEIGGIVSGEKFDPREVRNQIRFSEAMREYGQAIMAGKDNASLAELEKKAEPFKPAGFEFGEYREQLQASVVFREYMQLAQSEGEAEKLAEAATKLGGLKTKNPDILNQIAWTLLTDEKIKQRDLGLASKLAKAAYDASEGKDASVVDTYARALFETGKVSEAIEHEKKAIELCDDEEMKSDFVANLKKYQEKAAKK
ncbi:MAG: redoxin domain-containing protein [Verrucomicrobia bacterium]|jgi:thiol-disulfide isomerase/thioredoxin|nr:redoxin domain-containing protein [Verrucomicrobiota bacterium]OQC66123.1 MAG: Thiol-disulfide oxidoreductase ResA [Verrucomicrobia bacterium ADurb.Bin006]MDI9380235.1 redoxin family protein [Verrucomicrobiota bacterium]NMD21795.1 redoxin domain-containing protein [Verrucomicrobiota bacterium]HNV00027.1 redoxin family protein [Verrucomicrobiota bacterium]